MENSENNNYQPISLNPSDRMPNMSALLLQRTLHSEFRTSKIWVYGQFNIIVPIFSSINFFTGLWKTRRWELNIFTNTGSCYTSACDHWTNVIMWIHLPVCRKTCLYFCWLCEFRFNMVARSNKHFTKKIKMKMVYQS